MLSTLMLLFTMGASTGEVPDVLAPTPWDDAAEVTGNLATGTVEICEVLTMPLGWVPEIGTALGIVAEWGCLVPGAIAGDYLQRQHGTQRGHIWQGTLALAVGKVWRDATRVGVAASIIVTGFGVLVVVAGASGVLGVTVWPVAPLFLPLALAAVVSGGAISYALVREVRKSVQEALFRGTYQLLTRPYPSREAQVQSQQTALLRPRHNIIERNFYLAAMAAGAEAEHRPLHMVPLIGPIARGVNKAHQLQTVLKRVAREDIGENPLSWTALERTTTVLTVSEGVLGSLTQAALVTGSLLAAAGGVMVLAQLPLGFVRPTAEVPSTDRWAQTWVHAFQRAGPVAILTGLLGVGALAVVSSGVVFLVLREVPKALLPWVVPLVFGPIPQGSWFPERVQLAPDPSRADKKSGTDALEQTREKEVDAWLRSNDPAATEPTPSATEAAPNPPSTEPAPAAPDESNAPVTPPSGS